MYRKKQRKFSKKRTNLQYVMEKNIQKNMEMNRMRKKEEIILSFNTCAVSCLKLYRITSLLNSIRSS